MESIRKTVEDHDFTVASDNHPSQEIYFRLNADTGYPNLYCAVPTDFADEKVGKIVTAYYTKQPVKGGTVKHVNIHK